VGAAVAAETSGAFGGGQGFQKPGERKAGPRVRIWLPAKSVPHQQMPSSTHPVNVTHRTELGQLEILGTPSAAGSTLLPYLHRPLYVLNVKYLVDINNPPLPRIAASVALSVGWDPYLTLHMCRIHHLAATGNALSQHKLTLRVT
jgi:hypothetical protein